LLVDLTQMPARLPAWSLLCFSFSPFGGLGRIGCMFGHNLG
jgi:hypothetical protein